MRLLSLILCGALMTMAAPAPASAGDGCGRAPPASPPGHLFIGGERRQMIVAVPQGYDPARPHRLILAFHGRTNGAARVRSYFGLERIDGGQSLFVYPQALRQADGTFIWSQPEDVRFVEEIITRMDEAYCIDRSQVFAVGHSLGASFANTLACLRGDLFRGVGTVAGGIAAQDCDGEGAAALLIHHPRDRLVPVSEGLRALDVLTDPPTKPRPGPDWFRACTRFDGAQDGNPVVWCLHDAATTDSGRTYAHQWPPGAERVVLEFFDGLER